MSGTTGPRHLLVAGAQRCGTTYLYTLLTAHPDIAGAEPSRPEPKVWSDPDKAVRGREWYDATYFAAAGTARIRCDKSTSYLESAETADRARIALGDPLALVQLRDPIERAASHWGFSTENGLEERPLAEALAANLEGPLSWDAARTSVSPYAYLERGHYATYVEPWLARFGPAMRVVFLEELTAEPERIGEVYAWLGVDDGFRPPDADRPVNAGSVERSAIGEDLHRALREHFAASDRRLAELLGRPLPWRATGRSSEPDDGGPDG